MTTYLLDANVLIALTIVEHEHHARASVWAAGVERFAVCPIVEGALARFLVRIGEKPDTAVAILRQVRMRSGFEFWPDSLSYADASLGHVRGHRQVTDAYLVSLAAERGGVLVTMDEALVRVVPQGAVRVPPL